MAGQLVGDGVHRFHSRFVNWYLVEEGDRLAAIDAGLPPDWQQLNSAALSLGRSPRQLVAVVLTHAHVDHLGFAERARRELGARVYIHEADANLARSPLKMAKSQRPPLAYLRNSAARSAIAAMLLTRAFMSKPIRGLTTFRDGETLSDVPGKPRVVFTPGHTFGHSTFHLPDRDLIFTGDALVTCGPYTGALGPQIVSRAATANVEQALRSLERIAETGAGTLLTGHGEPWRQGAEEAVRLAQAAGAS